MRFTKAFSIYLSAVATAIICVLPVAAVAAQSPAEDQYTEQAPDPSGGKSGGGNSGGGGKSDDGSSGGSTSNGGSGSSAVGGSSGSSFYKGSGSGSYGFGSGGGSDSRGDSSDTDGGRSSDGDSSGDFTDTYADAAPEIGEVSLDSATVEESDDGVGTPVIVGAALVVVAAVGCGWWAYRRRGSLLG